MTEITRVPLRPIKKGSLTKLWLAVAAIVLAGGALAWAAMPQGIDLDVIERGVGPTAKQGDVVFVKYTGKLADGTVFDESRPLPIPPGLLPEGQPFPVEEAASIPGFYQGLQRVRAGGKYVLTIPADLAYGAAPPPGSDIPPNSELIFEMEVTEFMSRADFEARAAAVQQFMQQQMQQQMDQGGAPQGPPAGPPGQ